MVKAALERVLMHSPWPAFKAMPTTKAGRMMVAMMVLPVKDDDRDGIGNKGDGTTTR